MASEHVGPAERLDPMPMEALAKRAVESAVAAGATYADARLTRDVAHCYLFGSPYPRQDVHTLGVGVRALVNGYWGFASSTLWDPDEVARLAQEAVAIAKRNAKGPPRAVELGRVSAATGRWATPVKIDPFAVPLEEKKDAMDYWLTCIDRVGGYVAPGAFLVFARQERTVATSEGSCVTQTLAESGGAIRVGLKSDPTQTTVPVRGIHMAGAGWERLLDADIPTQVAAMPEELREKIALTARARPVPIGQYTLVCDGDTMAMLAVRTLGLATQLDRALGYEANAGGTSYLDAPLTMVGQEKVAMPGVTLTGDRGTPGGLATVKWDDEGVEPDTATLVKDGVLTDFQTTRESATWLKDYYAKVGKPVRSHGHAVASTGVQLPLQQLPNLALASAAGDVSLEELIGSVKDGLYIEGGTAQTDFQAKSGLLFGDMRYIKDGRLGQPATGGAVLFNSADVWKKVSAVGGAATRGAVASSRYVAMGGLLLDPYWTWWQKGQPPQANSHTATAPAAVIPAQAVIDPSRKA